MSHSNIYVGLAGYVGRPEDVGAVGVFRRPADAGEWEHVLDSHEAYSIFVHPKDPNLVFAGTSDGIWRSEDSGASFQRTDFPDTGKQVWSFIAIDDKPDCMYAGASPIDVYRSEDRVPVGVGCRTPGSRSDARAPSRRG